MNQHHSHNSAPTLKAGKAFGTIQVASGGLQLEASIDHGRQLHRDVRTLHSHTWGLNCGQGELVICLASVNGEFAGQCAIGKDAEGEDVARWHAVATRHMLRGAKPVRPGLEVSSDGGLLKMARQSGVHKDEITRSGSPYVARGQIPVDDFELMACAQTLAQIRYQLPHLGFVPLRTKPASKVFSIETLLHPRDCVKWTRQFDGIGQNLDHMWGVNRSEQLDLPVRSSARQIALGSLRNEHDLDHDFLATHLSCEDHLLSPLDQGRARPHTKGRFQLLGELLKINHRRLHNASRRTRTYP